MTNNGLCMGCMKPLNEGDVKCKHCGYPIGGVNPPDYMRVRTVLADRYLVGRVLEVSGDSAVYMGLDKHDNTPVTIREFYPATLCERDGNGFPRPLANQEESFFFYRQKFLTTARSVARARDVLAVVPCFDIFEENGTAYSISEYCEGVSLEKYVHTRGGALPYEEVRRLFLPLITAMSVIHAAGILHLGICPKNVLVDSEGKLRIKNFSIPETHTVNTACQPCLIAGYSAPEQYEQGAVYGAAADVYGMAATLFFALTGKNPAEATVRMRRSEELLMPAEVADTLPAYVKESLYRALRIHAEHRTATMQQLLDELSATSAVAALIEEEEAEEPQKKSHMKYLWLIFVAAVLALAILAVFALEGLGYISFGGANTTPSMTEGPLTLSTTATTTEAVITTTTAGEKTYGVDSLIGKTMQDIEAMALRGNQRVEMRGYEFSAQPVGTVVAQTPEAGSQVSDGTVIYVTLSAGSAERTMPDLTAWPEQYARLYLQALGYQVKDSLLLQVSEFDRGLVEKTEPAAGSPIQIGDSVTLWVSDVDHSIEDPEN